MRRMKEFAGADDLRRVLFVSRLRDLGGPIPPDRVRIRHEEDETLHYFAFYDPRGGSPRTLGWTCPKTP